VTLIIFVIPVAALVKASRNNTHVANDTDSNLFPWILSGLIVAIATVAVVLGSTDGPQPAPTDPAPSRVTLPQMSQSLQSDRQYGH
jgi:hypothetical protein